MKSKLGNLYVEQQSFFTWWLGVLMVVIIGVTLYGARSSIASNSWGGAAVGAGVVVAVIALLIFARLRSRIDAEGVHIRFFPLVWKEKTWHWEDIGEIYVKRYSPWEYGGWGYRLSGAGTAYSTKGNYGIQLVLKKNGSRVLVGTQNPEEVQRVLSQIKSSDHEN